MRTKLLLQMNTEGHEYDVLLGLSEAVAKRQRASPTSFPTLDRDNTGQPPLQ